MRSLVTGGSGFVGRALVDALVERGDDVTVLDVTPEGPRPDIRYLRVDLRDSDETAAACENQDVVFHTASLVHTRRNREEEIHAVNVGGTENVMAGCRAHGVPRLVYLSSASVVYEGVDICNGDESLPHSTSQQAPYAESKIEAERLVLAANDRELATVAIRPHVVFGPGDQRFIPAIVGKAREGKLRWSVGWERKLSDFTWIGNLVDSLLLADERLKPGSAVAGQAYFITNGEPIPFWAFIEQLLARMDFPPIRGAVPYSLAYAVAAVVESLDTLRGGTLNSEDGFSRFAIRYMCTHHYFSIDKARRDLGYEPRVSIAEGIDLTAANLEAAAL